MTSKPLFCAVRGATHEHLPSQCHRHIPVVLRAWSSDPMLKANAGDGRLPCLASERRSNRSIQGTTWLEGADVNVFQLLLQDLQSLGGLDRWDASAGVQLVLPHFVGASTKLLHAIPRAETPKKSKHEVIMKYSRSRRSALGNRAAQEPGSF